MTAAPRPSSPPPLGASASPARSNVQESADEHEGLCRPNRGVAVAVVLSAMAMVVIDGGMSTVALPTLAASLHIPPSEAILIMTAYQAAVVMTLLPSAALAERFGHRRIFALGVGFFSAASLASALAPALPWLIAARFVQGLGGAAILALGVALLRASVSDARLGAAIGWNALTVALAAAAAPALATLIISAVEWRWVYVAGTPLAALVLIGARALPFVAPRKGRIDVASILLNCAAFSSVVIGASTTKTPLFAAGVVTLGALSFLALVMREAPKQRPLVPFDLLRNPSFSVSVVASICCFTGQTAGLIALPFHLQHGLELPAATAGLYLTAWPLSVAVTAPLAGFVMRRSSTAWVCAFGALLLTAGLAATAAWPMKGSLQLLVPFIVVCGIGFGLFQVANNRNMFLAAPSTRSAAAGGMQGTARLMGQTSGALIVAQLFALTPLAAAPQVAMGIGSVLAFAAGAVSLLRVDSR